MSTITTTIAGLRALTSPSTTEIYYTMDLRQEGEWWYDPADTASADNTGTILVSGSYRFKRIYDRGFVNAVWFYNSLTDGDATPYIQRALDYISKTDYTSVSTFTSGGGTVFLPKGAYLISAPLKIGQHCKLLGAAKSATHYGDGSSGSILLVNPNTISTLDMWAIESATYDVENLVPPIINPPIINFNSFYDDGNLNTHTHGIIIEQITIYANGIYGALRLTNSPYSIIRNVSVYDAKIGIYLNNCWNCSIEDSYVRRVDWYGIVLAETNVCAITNTAVNGKGVNNVPSKYLIDFGEEDENIPLFVPDFSNSGLDTKVKYGRTGIYICHNGNANEITNCSSEVFTNGIFSLVNCNTFISTAYIENIVYYGIVIGIGESLAVISTVYFEGIHAGGVLTNSYPFYFGSGSSVTISAANCMRYSPSFVGDLFKVDVDDVYVTFSNTKFRTRKYNKHVFFLDETPNGANLGSVYIDPTAGSDNNYGFNENDALATFDEALVRVQNQSTLNPVKTIRIKAFDPELYNSAAFKDESIKEIENCNILITGYTESDRPRLSFTNFAGFRIIGQIRLNGNVNLHFRNVDILFYEDEDGEYAPDSNRTGFALNKCYANLVFENSMIIMGAGNFFSLVKSVNGKSSLEVKFVNVINITGNSLSANDAVNKLLVDCVQINSIDDTGSGWLTADIIRNNF